MLDLRKPLESGNTLVRLVTHEEPEVLDIALAAASQLSVQAWVWSSTGGLRQAELRNQQPIADTMDPAAVTVIHGTFEEDIRGTATEHIPRGLFEAHARDEAGFEDEAGHDRMWFAARDIAFEHPVTTDQTAIMLERMGISGPGGAPLAARELPDAFELESMLARMIGLLFIEISAFHTFRWAEEVLSDPELTAGDGEAARIVSYIRADETPHVGYLEVALSEMRDRTWIGTDGTRFDGAEMMPIVWDTALEQSMVARRSELLQLTMREIESALGTSGLATSARDDLLEEMFSLGTVDRLPDGRLVDRAA